MWASTKSKRSLFSINNVTLTQVFEQFKKERQLQARTKTNYAFYMKRYFEDWSTKAVNRIDAAMVMKHYQDLVASTGAAQGSVAMRMPISAELCQGLLWSRCSS